MREDCEHTDEHERKGDTWPDPRTGGDITVYHYTCLYCGRKRVKQTEPPPFWWMPPAQNTGGQP